MEKGTALGTSSGLFRYIGIFPRICAIVLAVILIGVSAGTIGIINNNEFLDALRDTDRDRLRLDFFEDLQDLTNLSLAAAGWLIALCVGVLFGEVVAIVLAIINFQSLRLVVQIIEIVFSILVTLCYVATGIACAVYASMWGEPPEPCGDTIPVLNIPYDCDEGALTATNAVSTAFCFIQAAIFVSIVVVVIYTILKTRSA